MFQDGQLFAHRTVGGNVAYGLPRGPTRASPSCSSSSAWPATSPGRSRRCPAASASASPWPARWPRRRGCCCSTSRCPPSTARCASASPSTCAPPSSPPAPPPCSSRTTRTRRSPSPTASPSWPPGGCCRSTQPADAVDPAGHPRGRVVPRLRGVRRRSTARPRRRCATRSDVAAVGGDPRPGRGRVRRRPGRRRQGHGPRGLVATRPLRGPGRRRRDRRRHRARARRRPVVRRRRRGARRRARRARGAAARADRARGPAGLPSEASGWSASTEVMAMTLELREIVSVDIPAPLGTVWKHLREPGAGAPVVRLGLRRARRRDPARSSSTGRSRRRTSSATRPSTRCTWPHHDTAHAAVRRARAAPHAPDRHPAQPRGHGRRSTACATRSTRAGSRSPTSCASRSPCTPTRSAGRSAAFGLPAGERDDRLLDRAGLVGVRGRARRRATCRPAGPTARCSAGRSST